MCSAPKWYYRPCVFVRTRRLAIAWLTLGGCGPANRASSSDELGGSTSASESDSSTDSESTDSESTDSESGDTDLDYPEQRVGIFYLAWHAYAADAIAQIDPSERYTYETVIRSPTLHASDMLATHGLLGQASSFHYHAEPELGFYCLYRRRPTDPILIEPEFVPDCPNISAVAATHAAQLWTAGVDFVYVDLTNFNTVSTAADVLALRPFEVLLAEWAALRAAGQPTPQIAAWLPAAAVDPGQIGLIEPVLDLYADPAFADLLLGDQASGRKVVFIVDNEVFSVSPANLALIEAQDLVAVPLWGNLPASTLAAGTAGWMQPCTVDGEFTTLVGPANACNQGHANTSIGSVLSVSASYQLGYASLPYQSSGRLEGLTLKQQFATAFALQPDYLLINAWNEHIAQPQPNPHTAQFGAFARSMGETDVPLADPGAEWLWVDMAGRDLGRDIEPSQEDGDAAYLLMQSCLRVYRSGHVQCTADDQASEACCQLGAGMTLVRSLRHASDMGQMTSDHVPTTSEAERDALVETGVWVEVCNPFYGPPGLCGNGTTRDGPFSVFAADLDASRTAIWRCHSGIDHFLSTSATCEGTEVEGLLGWASTTRTSATPRSLHRCHNTSAQVHFHWLDDACPALPGVVDESILGYVR